MEITRFESQRRHWLQWSCSSTILDPWCPWDGSLGWPQRRSARCEEEENLLLESGIELRSFSPLLYRLSCRTPNDCDNNFGHTWELQTLVRAEGCGRVRNPSRERVVVRVDGSADGAEPIPSRAPRASQPVSVGALREPVEPGRCAYRQNQQQHHQHHCTHHCDCRLRRPASPYIAWAALVISDCTFESRTVVIPIKCLHVCLKFCVC
jgi:hypothetical protein